jgi:hypothetical protein
MLQRSQTVGFIGPMPASLRLVAPRNAFRTVEEGGLARFRREEFAETVVRRPPSQSN